MVDHNFRMTYMHGQNYMLDYVVEMINQERFLSFRADTTDVLVLMSEL